MKSQASLRSKAKEKSVTQRDLPMIELHRHLEGCMRPQTILELGEKHARPLAEDLEGVRALLQVTEPQPGLMPFILRLERAVSILGDLDACARVALECVEDASREGLAYLELRFSPYFMAMSWQLDLAEVVNAVADGVRRGERNFGLRTNLIGIMSRTFGPQTAMRELQALLTHRDKLVALDLAGDEARWPGEHFVEHFRIGRKAGWHINVHAGEAAGPAGIWQAVNVLGAERLGHAVHAGADPALISYLGEHKIGIESCLTSNVQTKTVTDYSHHPIRSFLEQGQLATINTDNPTASGVTLPYELSIAAPAAGLNTELIHQAKMNALTVAFLSNEDKAILQRQ